LSSVILLVVTEMPLLKFVAWETDVCVPLPSKLTPVSAAVQALMQCFPSRCIALDYSVTIYISNESYKSK
jgi:hypothetical protein